MKLGKVFVFVFLILGCLSPLRAQFSATDGIYGSGSSTIEVKNGLPITFRGTDFHYLMQKSFEQSAAILAEFGITLSYELVEESDTSFTLITHISYAFLGEVYTSSVETTVSYSYTFTSANTVVVSTDVTTSSGGFEFNANAYTETIIFNATKQTFTLVFRGTRTTYSLKLTGDGETEITPLLPPRFNWLVTTTFTFPVLEVEEPVWTDPPYAEGFLYTISPNRKERFSGVKLPSGFGNNINVSVYKKVGKKNAFVSLGTFASGSTVDFDSPGGVSKFRISGIRPTVDLKATRPYPAGLLFTKLNKTTASFKMSPLKKLKTPIAAP